jgi:hypothetical protein
VTKNQRNVPLAGLLATGVLELMLVAWVAVWHESGPESSRQMRERSSPVWIT